MASLALLAIVVVLAAAAAACRPGPALAVLMGTVVLVPGALPVPGLPGLLTVHRVVVLAALAGLLWRCLRRDLDWSVLSPPPTAYRFAVVLGGLAVLGVGLLQPSTDPSAASRVWQALAAQLVLLVTAIALARAAGRPETGVMALVVATAVGAGIAVIEHVTGQSYARLWFRAVPALLDSGPAQVLATRGGDVRVRAAGDFTLAYAWTTAAVVPLLVVAAARSRGRRRPLLLAAVPLVLLAIGWTYSRSVAVPVLLAVVLALAVTRDRSLQVAGSALAVVATGFVALNPSLLSNFSIGADTGSIAVRTDRLPAIAALVAGHPFRGLGLGGLTSLGITVTDSTFLLGYAEVGAIGLAALVGLLLAGCAAAYGGVLGARASRPVAFAAGTGALLLIVGTFSFDAFTTATSAETFWLLVALGVVAAERTGRRVPTTWLTPSVRVLALLGLAAIGLVLRVTAPSHRAQTWQFDTLRPALATALAPTYTGVQLRTTVCDSISADLAYRPGVASTCQPFQDGPGQGLLRLQAPNAAALGRLTAREVALIHRIPTLERVELRTMGPAETGIPAALRTAPAWLPVLGAVWLLPMPGRRRDDDPR